MTLGRIAGWVAFLSVMAGITVFMGGWDALSGWATGLIYVGAGFLVVQAVIVEPIRSQIRELEAKIDGLQRRLDRR